MTLVLTGISTPASGAGDLKVLETTTTVSSVQTSGEIWRGLIPTNVVLMQGEYHGELKFPIEGRLAHKVLADRSLGVDVEFELWSSAGKKIAYDTVYSSDWNPVGPNTLVSMTIYQSDLSASATYTLLIRTVYKVSTTGLLSRYLEDKKTLNFKIVEAKLPSKVTQKVNVADEFEIQNALDSTSYEIGIGFTKSDLTNADCTKVPSSSYLPPVVIKTVTSLKFKLTDEDLYEIAKRLGASLNSPYRTVVRGVNQFGVGDWSNGFCGDKFFSPALAAAEARAAATTDGTNKSQVKPNSSNSTQSAVSNRDSFQACEEINYEVEVLLAQAEEFNKKIEAFKRQFGKSLRKFVFYDAFHPLESVMCSSDVKEYNNQARNLVLGNAQEELKFLEQKYEEVSRLYKTISCIKGKVTKQIKGMNPKCPKGYKMK